MGVYTDNPLKQGLKQEVHELVGGDCDVVYTDNPLKQGLKLRRPSRPSRRRPVYTDNPLKQGLKLCGGRQAAARVVSTRTIH